MKTFAVYAGLLAAFFITACYYDTDAGLHFDSDLEGTWVSNVYYSAIYSGTLIINHDRITIIGYDERQTPLKTEGGDDNNRPFKGFTKETHLKGYSEEGKIFIEDGGMVQEGIPYIYWESPDNKKVKFLRFTFGNRVETLENSLNAKQ